MDPVKNNLMEQLHINLDTFFYNMKAVNEFFRDPFVGEAHFLFLQILWESKNPLKVSDIATKLQVTNGAITGLSDKLLNLELINRVRSENDRRVVWISLTDKGKEYIEAFRKQRFEFVRKRLETINSNELTEIVGILERLNSLLLFKDK